MLLVFCFFIVILMPGTAAAAESGTKIPGAFWSLVTPYQNAVDANDLNNIIVYGNKIIELFNLTINDDNVNLKGN